MAAELGVLPPILSAWLNGQREPGGEATLQLLKWVVRDEAQQQKKRAERADTRPALKTRQRKSTTNEKAKSGPRRKR
jgi:hypothetical protein